ncbi:MAG: bifunctional diaminohydroxyphosphoribosylaminopyrimidine deaminase/5-amino-6-(5-phosphoribosylamino)uracil reductase RibD, partial [Desulfocapsaceae bacterium]|nr:bifunctional diaminohydroxyphosphoribosylaminopyrimidine deaminase/5-amino-6-(5-phosphoribosylamino)uracil reductase RibD [Desulfocapsaceae bacterium]
MSDTSAEYFMRLALKEARKGFGRTSPNPCVGAIIVKDDAVIASGYHRRAGTPHAEIHALHMAGTNAAGADMYVTLEPCSHYGRTGPCSHAVAAAGIKKVIVGMRDPNPQVNGSGIDYLRSRGLEVRCGVLEKECREINKAFLKYILSARPLVVMKAGLSLDGRLSYRPGAGEAITGPESFRKVHHLRDTIDAILVGIGTVRADDPSLTTRLVRGRGRDPLRIVLDSKLQIDENAQLLRVSPETRTWIFCLDTADSKKMADLRERGIMISAVAPDNLGRVALDEVLKMVAARNITSVMVEGGATVHGAFLNERLVDSVYLFYAPVFAGDGGVPLISGYQVYGGKKQAIQLGNITTRWYGRDLLVRGD